MKDILICIKDCDPINHLDPSYWIKEGDIIKNYQRDDISLFIIKNGYRLIYNNDHFIKLSEHMAHISLMRTNKIDQICG